MTNKYIGMSRSLLDAEHRVLRRLSLSQRLSLGFLMAGNRWNDLRFCHQMALGQNLVALLFTSKKLGFMGVHPTNIENNRF